MKKELSPGMIVAAIVGLLAVVGIAIFFLVKSDPAMQAPNPPPRFDPGAMNADAHSGPAGGGALNGGPNAGRAPAAAPPAPAPSR